MKIFIGLTDIANVTANYAKGFRALGHQVFSTVWSRSSFYPDAEYDLVIDQRQTGITRKNKARDYISLTFQLARLAQSRKCDLFIHYAPAVLPTNLYYPLLKILGKKIVTVFWGSDIRYWYAFAEEMRMNKVDTEVSPFFEYARTRSGGSYWDKLRTIKTAEKYSDIILGQPDSGQMQTRSYMRTHIPLSLSEYQFRIPGRVKPLILHAPSVPEAKGTDIILRVIQELQEEGLAFEFRCIEKMPNDELRQLLSESDIVVDQLYSATVAGLAAEAMATGNAVLSRYMENYSKVPPKCPVINTNIFTLKENLRKVILNVDERKETAQKGRAYVEAYNDNIKICKDIINWLDHKEKIEWDFHPTFYKKFSIPKNILNEERKNAKKKQLEFFKTLLSTGATKLKK